MPRPTPDKAARRAPTPGAPRVAAASGTDARESTIAFSLWNFVFLAAGLLAVVAGYVLLSGGDTVAAPLLLVLGYVVLIPLGIFKQ